MNKKTKNEKPLPIAAELSEEERRRIIKDAVQPQGCKGQRMLVWAPLSTPDWSFWQDMPEVELWQACALSLNLDPDSLSPHYDGAGMIGSGLPSFRHENFPSAEKWEEFNKRLRLAEANIQQQNAFCPNLIKISNFVRIVLILSKPWDMPPELVTLVQKPKAQISTLENEPLLNDDHETIKDKKIKERNQRWQAELESMADTLIKEGRELRATKGHLAGQLAKTTGEDAATIERNTRKTW